MVLPKLLPKKHGEVIQPYLLYFCRFLESGHHLSVRRSQREGFISREGADYGAKTKTKT